MKTNWRKKKITEARTRNECDFCIKIIFGLDETDLSAQAYTYTHTQTHSQMAMTTRDETYLGMDFFIVLSMDA